MVCDQPGNYSLQTGYGPMGLDPNCNGTHCELIQQPVIATLVVGVRPLVQSARLAVWTRSICCFSCIPPGQHSQHTLGGLAVQAAQHWNACLLHWDAPTQPHALRLHSIRVRLQKDTKQVRMLAVLLWTVSAAWSCSSRAELRPVVQAAEGNRTSLEALGSCETSYPSHLKDLRCVPLHVCAVSHFHAYASPAAPVTRQISGAPHELAAESLTSACYHVCCTLPPALAPDCSTAGSPCA